jgi:hypothetical protein
MGHVRDRLDDTGYMRELLAGDVDDALWTECPRCGFVPRLRYADLERDDRLRRERLEAWDIRHRTR